MFIACPHCRYLVATAPRDRDAPAHCPRCGGLLGDATTRIDNPPATPARDADGDDSGPSLARLLRRDEAVVAPIPATAHPAEAMATDAVTNEPEAIESERVDPPAIADDATSSDDTVVAVETAPSRVESSVEASTGTTPAETPATAPGHRSGMRTPSFLHGPARVPASSTRTPRWQWAALCALALALVLQVMLADRARLAGDAGWRPLLATLCSTLGCSLPPWREPQAFAMLDRDVRPVPGAPGVLLAQATFRNDARWSQPWPVLMLTLRDADGRTLGARAVRPAEYLPRDGADATTTIGPGQSAQVAVRVREPSANVVAFSFDFR
ncbi:DUF3426 domain-containing protein [Pseudoxanthomonas beigongshangi]